MKIKLKLNNDTLLACRKLLNKIYDSEIPTTEAGKLIKSICLDTADKFDSKAKALLKKTNLFDKNNTNDITLKWFEAWGTYMALVQLNEFNDNELEKVLVQKVISLLNQKLT